MRASTGIVPIGWPATLFRSGAPGAWAGWLAMSKIDCGAVIAMLFTCVTFAGSTIVTISSGGCNALSYLTARPAKIYAVDGGRSGREQLVVGRRGELIQLLVQILVNIIGAPDDDGEPQPASTPTTGTPARPSERIAARPFTQPTSTTTAGGPRSAAVSALITTSLALYFALACGAAAYALALALFPTLAPGPA